MAVAWGYTLEKLQDVRTTYLTGRHPVAPEERRRFWRACIRRQCRFVTSIVAGLNDAKRRQPWRSEQFSPPSLCKEPQRRRFVHGRQQALREGPAIAGGLNRHPSPNGYGKRASCRMLNRTWSEPPRERRSLEGSGYLGTPDGYGGFAWRNKAVAG